MSQYFYATNVFACVVDETAIFLKLKTDQYLGLDGVRSRLFQRLLQNVHDPETETLAAELVANNLLTIDGDSGRPVAPSQIELPQRSLLEPIYENPPRVTVGHFTAFISACISVRLALRHRGTCHALERFARSQTPIRRKSGSFGLARARDLVRVFRHLRPIVYGAFDNCLYDSLVLGDFLGRYSVPSSCVLGVRTMPFEAHCWLQTNGAVVNGVPEMIKRFTPILAV